VAAAKGQATGNELRWHPCMVSDEVPMGHPGRSVLPNRSIRYFGTFSNSVPEKVGTVRFLEKLGTEIFRFPYFGSVPVNTKSTEQHVISG